MPRDFAIYEVPVEDLDDPTDVFQTLKQRLEHQIREEAHLIVQSDPDKIDRAFFQIKRRPSLNATSSTKMKTKTKDNLTNQRQAMTTDQAMSSSLKSQPTLQEMRDRADKVIRQASINNQYDYSGAVEDQASGNTASSPQNLYEMSKQQLIEYIQSQSQRKVPSDSVRSQSPFSVHSRSMRGRDNSMTRQGVH